MCFRGDMLLVESANVVTLGIQESNDAPHPPQNFPHPLPASSNSPAPPTPQTPPSTIHGCMDGDQMQ